MNFLVFKNTIPSGTLIDSLFAYSDELGVDHPDATQQLGIDAQFQRLTPKRKRLFCNSSNEERAPGLFKGIQGMNRGLKYYPVILGCFLKWWYIPHFTPQHEHS